MVRIEFQGCVFGVVSVDDAVLLFKKLCVEPAEPAPEPKREYDWRDLRPGGKLLRVLMAIRAGEMTVSGVIRRDPSLSRKQICRAIVVLCERNFVRRAGHGLYLPVE